MSTSAVYSKKYRDKNKKIISIKKKIYQDSNKDKIKKYMKNYYLNNKEKISLEKKAYYKINSQNARYKRIKRLYKLSDSEYSKLLKIQNEVCAICLKKETAKDRSGTLKSLSVDHNHSTGEVRGLLCGRCNVAIGLLGDDKVVVKGALDYLLKYK